MQESKCKLAHLRMAWEPIRGEGSDFLLQACTLGLHIGAQGFRSDGSAFA